MSNKKDNPEFSFAERMEIGGAVSVEEVANWAGVGRVKVWAEVKSGRLKVAKLGRRTLVRATDAKAWLASLSGEAA